jgi:hypothetical protein
MSDIPDYETADLPPPLQVAFKIDFDQLKGVGLLGIRRAAAFLAIAFQATSDFVPQTLALTQHSPWHFMPEPPTEQLVKDCVAEFQSWTIGNSLKELDLHFSLFLDQTWHYIELASLHGKIVKLDYVIHSIGAETNAAKKLSRVMAALGEANFDTSLLYSLSRARNCLTHNAGVVTSRYTTEGDLLVIKWVGLELRLQQGDNYVVVDLPEIKGAQAENPDQPAELVAVAVERRAGFPTGQVIRLTAANLHEICFYYSQLIDKVLIAFSQFVEQKGISKSNHSAGT